VEYYNETIASNDKIEVIHINRDRTSEAMTSFMKDFEMPWPAVSYQNRDDFKIAMALYKRAVPQYTLVDGKGEIVANGLSAIKAKVAELAAE
jgi:hypothetical protein